jgi:hypothetical protein
MTRRAEMRVVGAPELDEFGIRRPECGLGATIAMPLSVHRGQAASRAPRTEHVVRQSDRASGFVDLAAQDGWGFEQRRFDSQGSRARDRGRGASVDGTAVFG